MRTDLDWCSQQNRVGKDRQRTEGVILRGALPRRLPGEGGSELIGLS